MSTIIALVNVLFIFLVAYWLGLKYKSFRKIFWPALIVKVVAGLFLGLVYKFHYTVADTFLFFDDATLLTKLGRHSIVEYLGFLWQGDETFSIWKSLYFHEPRSVLFVKVISVFNFLTADNYWITSLYFSFITFYFSWLLVMTVLNYFPHYRTATIISFLFVPSVVFWSAGILKESLSMVSIFFIANVFVVLWMKDKPTMLEWIGLIISVFVLWKLRYYYAAILFPVLTTSLIIRLLIRPIGSHKKPVVEFCWWVFIFSVLLFGVTLSRHNFKPDVFFNLVLQNNLDNIAASASNRAIHFYDLQSTLSSFVINSPWALFSGLFRPFIWEAGNLFQYLYAIENLIILILAIAALRNTKDLLFSENRLLIFSMLLCSFLLCIFLALSTPNFGTLSRYRTGFLPFFVFVIVCKNPAIEFTIALFKRTFGTLFGR